MAPSIDLAALAPDAHIPVMGHEGLHEAGELLSEQAKDFHRAIISLIEELEAIDWYQQRADVIQEESLKAVLRHNLNEEVEHAMMLLEWMRRRHPKIDESARTYLFTDRAITEIEKEEDAGTGAESPGGSPCGLGIGSLRRAG